MSHADDEAISRAKQGGMNLLFTLTTRREAASGSIKAEAKNESHQLSWALRSQMNASGIKVNVDGIQ